MPTSPLIPLHLPPQHCAALQWFADHVGQETPWPQPLPDGTLLATKAKGIYKPAWTKYALSVRQSLGGPYPDRDPLIRPDGTWTYLYFQENDYPDRRDDEYTNVGLMQCLWDQIPVGVFIQTKGKPNPLYMILGIALVARWDKGYFLFEGLTPLPHAVRETVSRYLYSTSSDVDELLRKVQKQIAAVGEFDASNLQDAREKMLTAILRRRGQPQFRETLIQAYQSRCAVTQFDAVDALEAAHILPYRGPQTSVLANGLLLRADIHTLFDLGQIAVDTERMTVLLSPRLQTTGYAALKGAPLAVPDEPSLRPSLQTLATHRAWAGL